MPFGKAIWYIPTLTWQPRPQAERLGASLPSNATTVDLGAGGCKIAPHVKTVDFVKFPGTDYVCNVAETPFADRWTSSSPPACSSMSRMGQS